MPYSYSYKLQFLYFRQKKQKKTQLKDAVGAGILKNIGDSWVAILKKKQFCSSICKFSILTFFFRFATFSATELNYSAANCWKSGAHFRTNCALFSSDFGLSPKSFCSGDNSTW